MGTYKCAHSSLAEKQFGDRFAFTCNGCRELGYGTCYTCQPQCNFHLHNACHKALNKMSHPFFNQGQFILDKTMLVPPLLNHQGSLAINVCVACGTSVQGWRYVLTINGKYNVYLHPCCMILPHPTLHTRLEKVECVHCRQSEHGGVKGWAYVKDGVAVHVKCMKDMLYKDWEKRYYSPTPQNYANTNYSSNNYGEYMTQERGVNYGRPINQGGGVPGHARKRDYFLYGLDVLARVLNICSALVGFVDVDPIKEALLQFAGFIWGDY